MSGATILVADDDRGIRTVLSQALGRAGHDVRTTGTAANLWKWISDGEGDLVITDVVMPDENGLDLIPRIRKIRPDLRIVVMSAQNTLLTAVRAAERGAFEYLPKPFDLKEVVEVVERALSERKNAGAPKASLPGDGEEDLPLIGRSAAMQDIYRVLARLMNTDLTVMITGESGTGKELVARALHDYGKRRYGPFVAINMAAIPRELIESELFGHEKGAFTGATNRYAGRFEQAEGGTLFLDEIGDMPLMMQVKLLRVLQEKVFERVGGTQPIQTNVRIIAATHRDLEAQIVDQRFREDLYYRLNVFPIEMPPLRDRGEDLPLLIDDLLVRIAEEGGPRLEFTEAALDFLQTYPWPGNVRELSNLLERLSILYPDSRIDLGHLPKSYLQTAGLEPSDLDTALPEPLVPPPAALRAVAPPRPAQDNNQATQAPSLELPAEGLNLRDHLAKVEIAMILQALDQGDWIVARAAATLGLRRTTLVEKMRRYKLDSGR